MYKVEYFTIALMEHGTPGNIQQGRGVCYTDLELLDVERELNRYLKTKRRCGVVTRVERVDGHVIAAVPEVKP